MGDPQLAQDRAANDARPWWRKLLGVSPEATTPEARAREDAFWADQKTQMTAALKDDYQAKADVPIGAGKNLGKNAIGIANLGIKCLRQS